MPNLEVHVPPSAAATTRQRKRPKDEIAQLRAQVTALHEQLSHLRRFCSAPAAKRLRDARSATHPHGHSRDSSNACEAASVAASSRSFQRAVVEYKKLERAKAWNLQLRAELARQQQTNDTLTQLFGLQLSQEDVAWLSQLETSSASLPVGNDAFEIIATELLPHLDTLVAKTSVILAQFALRDTRCVFDTAHHQIDPMSGERGRSYEFLANTPLAHSYAHVTQFLWRLVNTNLHFKCPSSDHRSSEGPLDNCFEKMFRIDCGETHGAQELVGVLIVRRFTESRRTVIASTGKFEFPGSAAVIRHEGYVVLTDLADDCAADATEQKQTGAPLTLMQHHFRVFTDTATGGRVAPATAALRDGVLAFVNNSIMTYQRHVRTELLKAPASKLSEQHHRALCMGCVPCRLQSILSHAAHTNA